MPRPISHTAPIRLLSTSLPFGLAVALLLASPLGCRHDPRVAQVPGHSGSGTGSAVVESATPRLERRGAVLTVLTRVGQGAPAASRDRIALVSVTLESGAHRDQLDLPMGGQGVLYLPETEPRGTVLVEAFGPRRETVGHNRLDIDRLAGSIGVLALELSRDSPPRACRPCSAPEPLTEVRGLLDTDLYWSAWSRVVSATPGETLIVGTRPDASASERRALFEAAGARVVEAHLDEDQGVLWTLVRPGALETAVDVAVALAPRAQVTAFWLGDEWPSFWGR